MPMPSIACPRLRSPRVAFTLMEIILVVTIIGILASIVVPSLVGKVGRAKRDTTIVQMKSIDTGLIEYEFNTGDFPTTGEGLIALIERPAAAHEEDWRQIWEDMPLDAWGREFTYSNPSGHGRHYDLASSGRDRRFGTEDDINNWDYRKKTNP